MQGGGFNRRQHRPMIVQASHEPELSGCVCFSRLVSVSAVADAFASTGASSAARASRPTASTRFQMARSRSRTLARASSLRPLTRPRNSQPLPKRGWTSVNQETSAYSWIEIEYYL
jgi:hypothetical protein